MAEESNTPQELQPRMAITKSPDFRSMYCNYVQLSYSPYDICVIVAEATSNSEGNGFDVEHKARIFFNPAEAKAVAELLLGAVENHSGQFGAARATAKAGVME